MNGVDTRVLTPVTRGMLNDVVLQLTNTKIILRNEEKVLERLGGAEYGEEVPSNGSGRTRPRQLLRVQVPNIREDQASGLPRGLAQTPNPKQLNNPPGNHVPITTLNNKAQPNEFTNQSITYGTTPSQLAQAAHELPIQGYG